MCGLQVDCWHGFVEAKIVSKFNLSNFFETVRKALVLINGFMFVGHDDDLEYFLRFIPENLAQINGPWNIHQSSFLVPGYPGIKLTTC